MPGILHGEGCKFNSKFVHTMSRQTVIAGKGRYAYLLSDAAFKVVVCTPENEKLLIEIIELLLPGKHLSGITFLNKEMHGLVLEEKNVNFDLLCKEEGTGEEFLVEVQNREQHSFRDRVLVYSTYPIREQMAVKMSERSAAVSQALANGKPLKALDRMDYSLKPVYVMSMVNFPFAHESAEALEEDYISRYELRNRHNAELLTPALNFVFLEMDRLPWGPEDKDKCRNLLEKFIFSMKYMHTLTERPEGFDDPLLKDLYDATELGTMTIVQRQNYDKIMFTEIDRIATMDFAIDKAIEKGREEGMEVALSRLVTNGIAEADARRLLGLDNANMEKSTGLSE